MSDPSTDSVEAIFLDALDLPVEQRPSFLDERCGENHALRREVESLLAHASAANDDVLIGQPLHELALGPLNFNDEAQSPSHTDQAAADVSAAQFSRTFGRYQLGRLIGVGGMGAVYEAWQPNPRRRVALKILRPGLTSPALIKRFQREARILAQAQHPAITHIYDAGLADTPTGPQPYFAMEYVNGISLTDWSRQPSRSNHERLAMLADIADAIHHAHSRGIVHRDLKPGNILVDEDNRPRILDFGIARSTGADLHTMTLQTEAGQLMGTIPYMSPEQVNSDPNTIDHRSDIYALGVILYEMLSQRLPLEIQNRSIPEAARIILEEDPSRLSIISPACRGDVDTIVAKAMQKEPARRYQAAAELASDIRRYLRDEPIIARPASAFYHLGKFAKRNKKLVAVVILAFLGLSVATVLTTHYAISESALRKLADRKTYLANLVGAQMAIRSNDPLAAHRMLDQIPPDYAGTWESKYLRASLDSSNIMFPHPGSPTCIAYAPTGAYFATGSADGMVHFWDAIDDRQTAAFSASSHPIHILRFSPDGRSMTTSAGDGTVCLWDTETGKLLHEWKSENPRSGAVGVAFSPDGKRLAIKSSNVRFDIVDLRSGESVIADQPDPGMAARGFGTLQYILYAQDGQAIYTTGSHYISKHNPQTGEMYFRNVLPDFQATSIVEAPKLKRLIIGCRNKTSLIADADTLEVIEKIGGHAHVVHDVAVQPGGDIFATASGDATVGLWDIATGKRHQVLMGHRSGVSAIAFSPDGKMLASVSKDDHAVRIWNVSQAWEHGNDRVLTGHRSYVYGAKFDPSGPANQRLISVCWGKPAIIVWNLATGEAIDSPAKGSPTHYCLDIAHNGAWVATANRQAIIEFWNPQTATPIVPWPEFSELNAKQWGNSCPMDSIAISPDDRYLAVACSKRGRYAVFDLENKVRIRNLSGNDNDVQSCLAAASPDGLRLVMHGDHDARLIDAVSGNLLTTFAGHNAKINRVTFSPDGKRIITSGNDGTAKIWNAATGTLIATLSGHVGPVFDAVYSPDASRIATGSNDKTIRIWDAQTFEEIIELQGHEHYVYDLEFSPDGSMLVSTSGDTTLRVWDTRPRRRPPTTHAQP